MAVWLLTVFPPFWLSVKERLVLLYNGKGTVRLMISLYFSDYLYAYGAENQLFIRVAPLEYKCHDYTPCIRLIFWWRTCLYRVYTVWTVTHSPCGMDGTPSVVEKAGRISG